jgi:putative ABC transport system permease protein
MVYKQLVFMHNKTNDKMTIDNVLVINNCRFLEQSRKAFKQKLKSIPGVKSASLCSEIPGKGQYSNWGYPIDQAIESAHVSVFHCDEEFFDVLSIDMKEGRFFSPEFSSDKEAIVLNKNAIKRLGWQDNPIGKRYYLGNEFHVIGVAPDIHFESLQYAIEPLAFIPNRNESSATKLIVKIDRTNMTETIYKIEDLWNEFVPDRIMQYGFINKEFEQWYKSERRISVLAIILSVIAILLSSLGLFAAILSQIELRIKEIGIRKVNGAKIFEIVQLINKNIIIWVTVAYTIASPVSYFVIKKWLQSFAYQTPFSWWVFAFAGLLALTIALITVSWHSLKAARCNPVEALRYE